MGVCWSLASQNHARRPTPPVRPMCRLPEALVRRVRGCVTRDALRLLLRELDERGLLVRLAVRLGGGGDDRPAAASEDEEAWEAVEGAVLRTVGVAAQHGVWAATVPLRLQDGQPTGVLAAAWRVVGEGFILQAATPNGSPSAPPHAAWIAARLPAAALSASAMNKTLGGLPSREEAAVARDLLIAWRQACLGQRLEEAGERLNYAPNRCATQHRSSFQLGP